jgi:4-alpha-glucanotransferase
VGGRWVQAPGDALFEAVRREVPALEIIAEDLGVLTPPVVDLRDKFGFPGMKIGQFSFGDEKDAPERWPENCAGYTGTHDNETSRAWFEDDGASAAGRKPEQIARERAAFLRAAGDAVSDGPAWAMARLVWRSPARLAVAPLQDALGLGAEARMNRPGQLEGNWRWRLAEGALTTSVAGRLGAMTGAAGRAPEGT